MLNYIYAGIAIFVFATFGYYEFKVHGLESKVEELKQEKISISLTLSNAIRDMDTYKLSVHRQNEAIDLIVVEMVAKDEEIEELKNLPPEVKYNVIYRHIPEYIDIRKEDCETTNQVIDSIKLSYP